MPPTGEVTLKTKQAARRLGVSVSYLNKARAAGFGPRAFRYGRRIVYRAADIAAYAAAHMQEPVATDAPAPSPSNGNEGGQA
jgi:predicted DNA-binding transcriptional regulator AlpA